MGSYTFISRSFNSYVAFKKLYTWGGNCKKKICKILNFLNLTFIHSLLWPVYWPYQNFYFGILTCPEAALLVTYFYRNCTPVHWPVQSLYSWTLTQSEAAFLYIYLSRICTLTWQKNIFLQIDLNIGRTPLLCNLTCSDSVLLNRYGVLTCPSTVLLYTDLSINCTSVHWPVQKLYSSIGFPWLLIWSRISTEQDRYIAYNIKVKVA